MDSSSNTASRSHRPLGRRILGLAAALLAAVLMASLLAPAAGAAEPVSEVAAGAGSAVESVTASPPPAAAAPESSAAPASAPVPTPQPAAVTEPAAATVERSLNSEPAAGASHIVREAAHQSTEAVKTVAKSSGAADVPVVGEIAHGASETVRSSVGAATAESPNAPATHSPQSASGESSVAASANGHTAARAGGPGPVDRVGRVGPPAPRPASDIFGAQALLEIGPTAPGHAPPALPTFSKMTSSFAAAADRNDGPGASAPAARNDTGPLPSLGAAASSLLGSGFGTSLLLLGVLTVFALIAPRTPPRLLSAGRIHRSAPFVCALERPG